MFTSGHGPFQKGLERQTPKKKTHWKEIKESADDRFATNILTVKAEGKQSVARTPHPVPGNLLPQMGNLPVNMCPVFNLGDLQRELSCRRSASLVTWSVSTHGIIQYLVHFWDTSLPGVTQEKKQKQKQKAKKKKKNRCEAQFFFCCLWRLRAKTHTWES